MGDAKQTEIKNECRALERRTECLLINRDVINKHISYARADLVPFGAETPKTAQNDRVSARQFHVVVVRMLSTHRHDVRRYRRRWMHPRRQGIGDDLGSPA